MLRMLLFFSFLCCAFIESSEDQTNDEPVFLIALKKEIMHLLPYNPRILEIGGHEEITTEWLATQFPKGTLVIFESSEKKLTRLQSTIQRYKNVFVYNLSLRSFNENSETQSDLNLDEWCEQNKVSTFDLIRLDSEETDWSILKVSPKTLKTVSVISIKTPHSSIKKELIIKKNLEKLGFNLFPSKHLMKSPKAEEKTKHELVFIKKDIYDSIFN